MASTCSSSSSIKPLLAHFSRDYSPASPAQQSSSSSLTFRSTAVGRNDGDRENDAMLNPSSLVLLPSSSPTDFDTFKSDLVASSSALPSRAPTRAYVPRTQMEAEPPSLLRSASSTFAYSDPDHYSAQERRRNADGIFVEEGTAPSRCWTPEALNRLVGNSGPSSSASRSSSTGRTKTTAGPSADEAYSISVLSAAAPPTASGSCRGGTPALDRSTKAPSPAHPLTLDAPLHSAWNFETLFGARRTWFGGVRIPLSSDAAVDGEVDDLANRARRKAQGDDAAAADTEEEALRRQKIAFVKLRSIAQDRLKAIGNHFGGIE